VTHHHRPILPLALAAVTALAIAPAAAPAKVRKGPAGTAFYTPPKHTAANRHGAPIWARSLRGSAALKPAASNTLVLYRSTDAAGRPDAVSGTITVPKGEAPKGGWPILTWAHGTTGIADQCAPSRDGGSALSSYVYPQLDQWLKAGYAVVRTDYQGLGTPGVHGYLVGKDEGRSVLDMVRAARAINPRLSKRVIIGGHSQGGHAALWAAALAPGWTPELKVAGTVAFAPASHLGEQASLIRSVTTPSALTALAALILRGADSADPSLNVVSLLSDRAAPLYPLTLTQCLPALAVANAFAGMAPSEALKPDADLSAVIAFLNANDPEELHIKTPVEILQGTADTTVLPPFTDQLDTQLRGNGVKVTYKKFDGVQHGNVVQAGDADALAFARKQLRRR
jgi:pimeloyl-ACP methyl ester carboxylesterase